MYYCFRQSLSSPLSTCKRHQVVAPHITLQDLIPEQILDKDPPTPPVSDTESSSPGPTRNASPRENGKFRPCIHKYCYNKDMKIQMIFEKSSFQQAGIPHGQRITDGVHRRWDVCVTALLIMAKQWKQFICWWEGLLPPLPWVTLEHAHPLIWMSKPTWQPTQISLAQDP